MSLNRAGRTTLGRRRVLLLAVASAAFTVLLVVSLLALILRGVAATP